MQADIMMRRVVQVSIFVFVVYVVIDLLYGILRWLPAKTFDPAKAKALPHEGASPLVCAGKHAAAHFHTS